MKILILSPKLPYPPNDGGSLTTLNMATGISEMGNEVTLLCLNTHKHYFPVNEIPEYIGAKLKIIGIDHCTSQNIIKAFHNLIYSTKPFIAQRFNSEKFRNKLKELLEKEHFDIIQMEGPYMGIYIPLIKKYSSALIAFRAHNVESDIWQGFADYETNILRKKYLNNLVLRLKRFESEIFRLSDIFIPISEEVCRYFTNNDIQKPFLVSPTGLDIKKYSITESQNHVSFFFIGALDWRPNQDGLLWFLSEVWSKQNFKSTFHIAGRNCPDWLKKKINRFNNIKFYGEVENAVDFIERFSVMICPVRFGSGIRVKILEAMMMSKVVITTPEGVKGINFINDSHLIVVKSPLECYQKMIWICDNEEYAGKIGLKARKFVIENFNNFILCKKLNDFYRNNLK